MNEHFRKFAQKVSTICGSPLTFGMSLCIIFVWACTGPFFHYSDTWQLIINTGTTIITFLMVFLIQNTQNRDSRSLNLKIDELIRANKHARNQLIDLDHLSDQELERLHTELCQVNEQTEAKINQVRRRKSHIKPVRPQT